MSGVRFKRLLFVSAMVLPALSLFPHDALAVITFTPAANPAIQALAFATHTATFSNVNIGTASSDRVVVVGFTDDDDNCPISSVSIGGTIAALAVQSSSNDASSYNSSLWYANITSGTTANIVVACSGGGAFNLVDILVGTLTGESSAAPTATAIHYSDASPDPQSIPTSTPMTVPSNGAAVIFASAPSSGANTVTWTNTSNSSGDYYNATSADNSMSTLLAHSYASGSETYTVEGSVGNGFGFGGFAGVAAAWQPGAFVSSLQIDGHADDGGTFSSSNTDQVTLTTANSNNVIVLEEFNETAGGTLATVSSISDRYGLSWHLRSATSTQVLVSNGDTTPADMEIWYAIATSTLSSDTITMTLNNTTDDGSVIAFGVSGANTSSPWDGNASVPAQASNVAGSGTASVSGVSTNARNVMLLGLQGNGNPQPTGAGPATGYTDIDYTGNGGAANASNAEAEYEVLSSAASNATISFGSSISDWFMIGDAIQAASSGGSPTGRIIRLSGHIILVGGARLE
jgi:hypothetical protein